MYNNREHNGFVPHNNLNQRRHRCIQEFRRAWVIILFGIVLFVTGIFISLNNERDTVHQIISLDETLASVRTLSKRGDQFQPEDGELLHIEDRLYTEEPLTEPDYNIQVQAVKLKRRVQLFQWVEHSTEHLNMHGIDRYESDDRSYYYLREWKDNIVDSRTFQWRMGHENPTEFPISNRVQIANRVFLGRIELGEMAKHKFNDYIEITSDTRPDDPSIKLHSGLYYHCNNVFEPEIGDVRLQFYTAGVEGNFYTIIAKLENEKLLPYVTSIGKSVLILLPGRHTLEETFHAAHYERKLHAWTFRFFGWMLLFFSTICLSNTLYICLGDIQLFAMLLPNPARPFYGNVVLSLSTTIIIMSLSWIIFRPLLAIGMICAAISPFLFWSQGIPHYYQHVPIEGND